MKPHFNVTNLDNPSSRYSLNWSLARSNTENASPLWGLVCYFIVDANEVKGFLLEVLPMETADKLWWHANIYKAVIQAQFELYNHQDFQYLGSAKAWCEEEVIVFLNSLG